MKLEAYAKINPALCVVGKRSDGYHEVDMIMQTISLHDDVTVELREEPGILLTMNTKTLPVDERNIAYRAAKLMLDEYFSGKYNDAGNCGTVNDLSLGVRIHIEKNIPVAAGMAGGSTDCAAVIRALNKLLHMDLSDEALMKIGLKLGADVPFCICGGTMRSQGIGEILTKLPPMPDSYILSAKPDYSVSTREVYCGIDSEMKSADRIDALQEILAGFENSDLTRISVSMFNDLEKYTIGIHPDIDELKQIMLSNGAKGALMSGSGPTVFGIFEDNVSAEAAEKQIVSQMIGIKTNISKPVNEIK